MREKMQRKRNANDDKATDATLNNEGEGNRGRTRENKKR
jgi:hypothetical protein